MTYKHFGVMLDCSRNAVAKPETVKRMIDCLAKMGYNTLELYTEDTYTLPDEPYFGYLRGPYTKEEIQEIDAYAQTHGIELIPCIQTLAHFTNLVKQPAYSAIVDTNDILLIDDEQTYALIDKMFAFQSEAFTSRRINIGMDEAAMIGLGRFLQKNGYQNRYEILLRHLTRVAEIAAKYGFDCHMWSDMIFHLRGNGVTNEMIPKNVALTYWDYYHETEEHYASRIRQHKELDPTKEVWFAGGAWTWHGFAPFNAATLRTSRPAMEAVRNEKIENVLITMWGDDGKDCSFFSILPALYAIRCYADGNFEEASIKAGFEKLFGIPYDVFTLLDLPNVISEDRVPEFSALFHYPSKVYLYSDPFMGVFDDYAAQMPDIPYADYAERLEKQTSLPNYGYLFDTMAKLCRVMQYKHKLGVNTRNAYKAGNKIELRRIAEEVYPKLMESVDAFYRAFQSLWYKENKAFGFEVQDVRIGGVMLRLRSCRERLFAYVNGEIDHIDELDAEVLPRDIGRIGFSHFLTSVSTSTI